MSIFRIFATLLLFVFTSCECAEETLVESCPVPEPCFVPYDQDNVEANIIKGDRLQYYVDQVCNYGMTACDEDNRLVCEGYTYPSAEVCDNEDNDCDGIIDNADQLTVSYWDSDNPCYRTQFGVCKYSDAVCVAGEWVCIKPEEHGPEVCDGADNDCDGQIDEDIEEEFIYNGPEGTLNVGECRAGIKYCEDGEEKLFGMRTPIDEICGNDDDDDCDGFTDELETEPEYYDFLLVVDFSGSMIGYIESVATTICAWAISQQLDNSRFAVVGVAIWQGQQTIGVISDFANSAETCINLSNYIAGVSSPVGNEYQTDAVIHSVSDTDNIIELSWTGRTKKIIIFSDESLQYGQTVGGIQNVVQAIDFIKENCVEDNYSVSAFISWNAMDYPVWVDLTSSCSGYLDFLSPNPQLMIEKLYYWFGDEC